MQRIANIFFIWGLLTVVCFAQEDGNRLELTKQQRDAIARAQRAVAETKARLPKILAKKDELLAQLPEQQYAREQAKAAKQQWQNTLCYEFKLPFLPPMGAYNRDLIYLTELGGIFAADFIFLRTVKRQQLDHLYLVCKKNTTEIMDWLKRISQEQSALVMNAESALIKPALAGEFLQLLQLFEMPLHNVRSAKTILSLAGVMAANEGLPRWRNRTLVDDSLIQTRYQQTEDGTLQPIKSPPFGLGTAAQWLSSFIRHPLLSLVSWMPMRWLPDLSSDPEKQAFLTIPAALQDASLAMAKLRENELINRQVERSGQAAVPLIMSVLAPKLPSWTYSKQSIFVLKYLFLIHVANIAANVCMQLWVSEMITTRFEFYVALENYHNAQEQVRTNPTSENLGALKTADRALLEYLETSHETKKLFSKNWREWYSLWLGNRQYLLGTLFGLGCYFYAYYRIMKFFISTNMR